MFMAENTTKVEIAKVSRGKSEVNETRGRILRCLSQMFETVRDIKARMLSYLIQSNVDKGQYAMFKP